MKNKMEVENKLVELYYNLDKLKKDEIHGWSNNTFDIEKIQAEIEQMTKLNTKAHYCKTCVSRCFIFFVDKNLDLVLHFQRV